MPFQLVFGLDILSSEQIYGQQEPTVAGQNERIILPDTTHYIEEVPPSPIADSSVNVIFPKYNNYVKNPVLFDRTSKVLVPLSLLLTNQPPLDQVLVNSKMDSGSGERSVVGYAIFRTAGDILPQNFEPNLKQRYGVDLTVPSTVLSMAVLSSDGRVIVSSSGQHPHVPVKYRLRVDYVNQRAQPQCVNWKVDRATWSREGCRTEFHDPWFYDQEDFHVNCTCSSTGPVAVVMNKEEFMVSLI